MECPVCLNFWEEQEFTPLLLICGHTLCVQCVSSLIAGDILTCPSCYAKHCFEVSKKLDEDEPSYKRRCIGTMTRNMTLISLIASRPSLVQPQPKVPKSGRKFTKGMRCPEHHELIVFCTERPFSYCCLLCVEEVKHMSLQIKPIPEVVEYLQTSLKTVLTSCQRRLQAVEGTKKELSSVELEPLASLGSHIDKHFAGLQSQLKKTSGELKDYISSRIENVLQSYSAKLVSPTQKQVYALEADLDDQISRLERLAEQGPLELASKFVESDNILARSLHPLPQIECSDSTLKIRIRTEAQEEFARLIKASYTLSSEMQQGWICQNCAEENSHKEFCCEVCQNFRPLDTYPSLLTQPEKATQMEINELGKRRQMELQIISELDTGNEVSDWYLINTEWITQWKCFVFNKPSSYTEQNSLNQTIGVLPPGPISNHKLFTDPRNPVTLRPQLKAVTNYRGVNERVWKAYFKFYGGGPVIVRRKLNIYQEEVSRSQA
jgi:hypothetical protein